MDIREFIDSVKGADLMDTGQDLDYGNIARGKNFIFVNIMLLIL